ncbi:nudix-type motif 9 isoform X2 [Xenopus laevis]|uniref:ADP-ribose pyrophosphatase, mitochondrial n=1 Tax=Xenopus laevis TaxID=8355 RepID=A0A8J1LQ73_XENLA|nr:nudix-type motif 9 isoform X2 [Xenopus laevis]XP_041431717.1 nudix-type motif 9 isoform X2 [Xenopus laevis]XP_041431718.1 nudix-type motif 9 isoform X2 [Xenopus laevis]
MLSRGLSRGAVAVSITAAIAAVGSFLYSRWFRPLGSSSCAHSMAAHVKALTSPYPGSQVQRTPVPPEKICWQVDWPEYDPVDYTAPYVLTNPPWADPPLGSEGFSPKFNALDGAVQRQSLQDTYSVEKGVPRNPVGRTGVKGRGLLGRWGPNHAADPIITRWKQDSDGRRVTDVNTGKPILQFVAIQRKDCGQWAIPGGMVDPGELVTATLRREFCEEALNSLEGTGDQTENEKKIQELFSQEHLLIYKGYVDDPRNTDNSWMETQAVNYHDETGHLLNQLRLEAGDDAGKVQWVDVSSECSLYANHASFILILAHKRGAHW